jgi:hypothetical protein
MATFDIAVASASAPLHLVACVAGKAQDATHARLLYRSDWFIKARRYCESWGFRWAILSAKHGLVLPDQVIEPYNLTLLELHHADRQAWAEKVRHQVAAQNPSRLVLLAGRAYRAPFAGWTACPVDEPLAGKGIGDQKHWLAQHTLPRDPLSRP